MLSIFTLIFFIYLFQWSLKLKWKWQMCCWCLASKFEIIKRSGNGNAANSWNRQHRGYSSHRSTNNAATAVAATTGKFFIKSKEFGKNISDWNHDCTDHKNDNDFFKSLLKWPKIAVKKSQFFQKFYE